MYEEIYKLLNTLDKRYTTDVAAKPNQVPHLEIPFYVDAMQ
jgi:hypothetical protein